MEKNLTAPVLKVVTIANDKTVKTTPQIIQKNTNKEIILKSAGIKSTIQNVPTNQKFVLKIPNNAENSKTNFKIIPATKSNDEKLENGKNNETKTIKLNPEQLKNLFSGSINLGNNTSGVKKPIILSMEKFKTMMNNPNFHLNKNSIKVMKTNPNSSQEKLYLPKASTQDIKTYSKSVNSSKTSTTNEEAENIESTTLSQNTINAENHSSNEETKSNQIQQNEEVRSSPSVQTTTKNQSINVRLNNSAVSTPNSLKLNPQVTKIIKVHRNVQSDVENNISVVPVSKNQTLQIQLSNSTVSSPNAVKVGPQLTKTIKLTQNGIEKSLPLLQSTTKNQSIQIQVSNPTISSQTPVKVDSQSFKTIKLTNNLLNGVEKSSPVVQTVSKNHNSSIQGNSSSVSSPNLVTIDTQSLKTVKLNQNVAEKTEKTAEVQQIANNQKFYLPPNNRYRIIHQNGKQIALPIDAQNNLKLFKPVDKVSKSVSGETQKDKPQKVPEDKNPFVFDSMTLPIGARKIYTRRPKTPDYVYKKFNLPQKNQNKSAKSSVQSSVETVESTETVEKQPTIETNIKAGASANSKATQIVTNNVANTDKYADDILSKKTRMSRKRVINDFESANSNGAQVSNKSLNGLTQTLKSKFVPLVGHACTATIIEHINLAYSKCRISHVHAVSELIQYIDNYERYRDRKLLDSKKKNNLIGEKSTQTVEIEPCQCKQSTKNVEEEVISSSTPQIYDTNKRTEPKTSETSIVPDLTDEFSMFKLQLFKDWNTALVPDVMGNMPIHNAVLENDFYAVKRHCLILKHLKNINIQNESYDMTALHLAISNNCDIEIIEHLLENGVCPKIEDINGNNCLHMISQHGNAQIMELVLTKYRSPNLDLNTCNYNGSTPLMLCAEHNNVDIAKLLLQHKADTEVQDLKSGRTVLFQAIESNNEPMVKLLIEQGADAKKRDYGGITPLEVISEIRITPGIRKIMYKILSQNIVNLQRKRQRQQHLENGDDDVVLSPITLEKMRRINDENDDDNT